MFSNRTFILILAAMTALIFSCPSHAAIGFTQAQNCSTTSATNCTATITTSSGSALAAFCQNATNNTATITMTNSSGTGTWVQNASGYVNNGTTNRASWFYMLNAAAQTSVTCTWTAGVGSMNLVVCEITGIATSSAEDTSVNATQSGVTTATSGTFSTTNAADIILFGTRLSGAFTSPTAGTGYTIPTNGTSTRTIVEYKIVAATQSSVTATVSWTTSLNCADIVLALKAAPATGCTGTIRTLTGAGC